MTKNVRKVSNLPKRGYTLHVGSEKYVKNGYTLIKCEGKAHSNPYIDNCEACTIETWGWSLVKDVPIKNRRDLGEYMMHWHSSQEDPIYAVGSYYFSGCKYPKKEVVLKAINNLEGDLTEHTRMVNGEKVYKKILFGAGETNDLKAWAGWTDKELADNIDELKAILVLLKEFYKEDYK